MLRMLRQSKSEVFSEGAGDCSRRLLRCFFYAASSSFHFCESPRNYDIALHNEAVKSPTAYPQYPQHRIRCCQVGTIVATRIGIEMIGTSRQPLGRMLTPPPPKPPECFFTAESAAIDKRIISRHNATYCQ